MTPEQYVRGQYPDATDAMIKFFLKGYKYSLIMNDFETLWNNLPSWEKREYAEEFIDEDNNNDGYSNIDDAWDDLGQTEAMLFLKDKIQHLSIYELYQIMHNRIEELINEHQLMTTI
ncbi:MAG: hypothetical protein IJE18_06275 [Bacteroidaceae bacterium]|nr:hypothetical protein [Bacteroidaceae bacterium]MBQ3196541.1 hypothetical protein [Alistipes sp.]